MRKATFCSVLILISQLLIPATAARGQSIPADKLKQIEQMVTAKMSQDRIPGLSIAILVDKKIVWSKGYGLADVENKLPATTSTLYRSASIGKSITATAVMQLVERGKLDIDAPVQRYCPAFPVKRWPLTTRHLLAHMGGIRHYGGPANPEEEFTTKHYNSVTEALELFKDGPLLHEPGTVYLYSTYGYVLLGCVVEGASGAKYMDYLYQNVFRPAGMSHTRDDDPFAIIANRAAGYRLNGQRELQNSRMIDMSSKLPAGGFVTTAEDLALFAGAVISGSLVSKSTLEQMLTPQKTKTGQGGNYGLGWGLYPPGELWYGEKEVFHGGSTRKASGMLYMIPRRGFAVAFLMNLENVSERTRLAAEIAKIVLNLGNESPRRPQM